MSAITELQAAITLEDVATLLGYRASSLSYLLYVKPPERKYRYFDIPKKSGGLRHISAPEADLCLLQKRLSCLLQDCLEEIYAVSDAKPGQIRERISHGFRRKRSIYSNARQHRNRRYVFNIDLENFFGSINFGRVRGFFIADRSFSLNPNVATIIAQIACHENSLPQGSPCSPVISNLIGHILDMRLVRLAESTGCYYTRYADDLTFSTNKEKFPEEISVEAKDDACSWLVGEKLEHLIRRSGFSINSKKTRMQYRDSRQEVTGLVVNRKVNIKSEYRHTVRAMVHRLFTTGSFDFEKIEVTEAGVTSVKKAPGSLEQLHGMLGFVDWIDLENRKHAPKGGMPSISSKELMYRQFLMFKEFYAAPTPIVICEGKTDNIYIEKAIKSLSGSYPELAGVESENEIKLKVRIFKYSETSTGRILGLGGGTSDLARFIHAFKSDVSRFHSPGMRHPVIILIDNDSGANAVLSAVSQLIRPSKPDRSLPFIHVFKNMYVVLTPISDSIKESMIEDLFDDATKSEMVAGKKFDPSNDFNASISYGKSDFANKVVKIGAGKINFSGFSPLLDRLVAVIKDHAARGVQ